MERLKALFDLFVVVLDVGVHEPILSSEWEFSRTVA